MVTGIALLLAVQGQFNLEPLKNFNGSSMGGVVFDVSTDSSMKSQFKTDKGAIRPEALVISNTAERRVDALLDGRGGKAKAIGLWVTYREPVELEDLTDGLGSSTVLYAKGRSSNWVVHLYQKAGIAVFALQGRNRTLVDGVLLTDPARARTLGRYLEEDPTPIRNLQDEFDRLDQTVNIRNFSLSFRSKNIKIDDGDREKRLLESFAERRFETRLIRYRSGNGGTVSVTVNIDHVKVEVSASLNGSNQIGTVSGSGSSSGKFRESNDFPYYRRALVEDLVIEALNRAVDSAESAIQKQRPQTEAEHRQIQLMELLSSSIR